MSSVATTPESAATIRHLATSRIRWSLNHLLATFEATPDDKLDFKSTETARSPREMIVHLIQGNGHLGAGLGIEESFVEGPTDRDALAERLKASTELILSKIEALPDEAMDSLVDFLGNKMPLPLFLFLEDWHLSRHAAQIDYLQTTWGDMENRF